MVAEFLISRFLPFLSWWRPWKTKKKSYSYYWIQIRHTDYKTKLLQRRKIRHRFCQTWSERRNLIIFIIVLVLETVLIPWFKPQDWPIHQVSIIRIFLIAGCTHALVHYNAQYIPCILIGWLANSDANCFCHSPRASMSRVEGVSRKNWMSVCNVIRKRSKVLPQAWFILMHEFLKCKRQSTLALRTPRYNAHLDNTDSS